MKESESIIKMTNEEMIETLKGLVFGTFDRTTRKEREALDLAIQKLEQDSSDDCISRAQALHACCDEWNKDYKAIMKSIRQLPSITPCTNFVENQNKWIPVSERLPEETKRYLVYTRYDEVMTDFFYSDDYNSEFLQGEDIIAWMPLPEPYTESEK